MREGTRQRRICYRLLLTTLWATLLLLAVQATAGWASHSLTLLAEALHTLIDAFSTLLSLIAVASPQRPLGREVWGHGRAEVAATLMLAGFLGFTGVSLLLVALRQLYEAALGDLMVFPVDLESQVLQFTAAMVILNIALGVYISYQARTLPSLALRLNTQHFLEDAWLSLVTIGILLALWQGQRWLDPIFALVLLPLVLRSFWRVLNAQLPMLLLPTAIAPEAIAHLIGQVEGITHCTRIRSRGMVGRQVWIDLHLALHPEFITSAEVIAERVEAVLRNQYGPLRVQIRFLESHPRLDSLMGPNNFPGSPYPPNEVDWN